MADPRVETRTGIAVGFEEHDGRVHTYRGLPFAAPPIGALRWQPPQPAPPWEGERAAREFGPRCTQARIFPDMIFRDEMSEDCLYLNVWSPAGALAENPGKRLPVMVWIHGGGFLAGSASEPRQDGARLAQQGVVVVGINYRLGVFGFFAHPELTAESNRGAAGNQGLLDQIAALDWVRDNIDAFGGDPGNVTIFGESAGSLSVCALMAATPARALFHRAIGESGAFFPSPQQTLAPTTLAKSEQAGAALGDAIAAGSLAALRALPAEAVLKAGFEHGGGFSPTIDGHVLSRPPAEVFAAGEQSQVPLLAGWNADELRAMVTLAKPQPDAESFESEIRKRFGAAAESILAAYPGSSDSEARESAAALRGDLFVGHATRRWLEAHRATSNTAVYRYSFERKIPVSPEGFNGVPATSEEIGARHAGEIEYVFGALDCQPSVPWEQADRALSEVMLGYWSNFARTGDPNGEGLPHWPAYDADHGSPVMHLDVASRAGPDARRARYDALDALV